MVWTPFHHLLMRGRILGGKNLPKDGPYLILSNHTSALDPPWQKPTGSPEPRL